MIRCDEFEIHLEQHGNNWPVRLVIRDRYSQIAAIPMTREDWAALIGEYGDLLAGRNHIDNERTD